MTNQKFCYWLQGYFEISRKQTLTKKQVILIHNMLQKIHEPLGFYTQWLAGLIDFLSSQHYYPELLTFFLPEITGRLNDIFYHVIDNSYGSHIDHMLTKKIHDGKNDMSN